MIVNTKVLVLARALPLVLACLAATPVLAAEQDFDRALESYHGGRTSEAYGRFLSLGLKGDPDAARIALFMGENGAVVYRTLWELTDVDAANLRKVSQRPSLRPRPLPDMANYEANGTRTPAPAPQSLAGR